MRLTNDPTGITPSSLYLVIYHKDRHDLLSVPESYADLEEQVKRLYGIDRGQFYVEVDGLDGTQVRIPEEAWTDVSSHLGDDISQILRNDRTTQHVGRMYIVPFQRSSMETNEGTERSERASRTNESDTPNKGEIAFNDPFTNGKVLVFQVSGYDLKAAPTSYTKLSIRITSQDQPDALTISVFPKSGWVFLTTPEAETSFHCDIKEAFHPSIDQHAFIIRKDGRQFHVFCDFKPFGSIERSPLDSSLTSVLYDLGLKSPFKGPVSAQVYPNMLHSLEASALYQHMFPLDSETIFQQILSCDANEATYISEVLSAVRNRGIPLNGVSPAVRWHSHDTDTGRWIDLRWSMKPKSILITRFTSPQGEPPTSTTPFGTVSMCGRSTNIFLELGVKSKVVSIGQNNGGSGYGSSMELPSKHTTREHVLVFINQENGIHVVFDFCKLRVFEMTWIPEKIKFDMRAGFGLDAGVYEFGK